jgi:hypothetical protein
MANILLKTVERAEVGAKKTKMVFITADDAEGNEQKMSAFQEVWNDGWNAGDTVSVEIRRNGNYLNLYPTVQEANTVRPAPVAQPPREMADSDAIRVMSLSLRALITQEFTKINRKLNMALGIEETDDDVPQPNFKQ